MINEKATVADVLSCARDLIADPLHWTKGKLARDKHGRAVNTSDPDACKFCSIGAITKCVKTQSLPYNTMHAAAVFLERTLYGRSIIDLNDDPRTTHGDILNVFDKAIALAKENDRG